MTSGDLTCAGRSLIYGLAPLGGIDSGPTEQMPGGRFSCAALSAGVVAMRPLLRGNVPLLGSRKVSPWTRQSNRVAVKSWRR